MAHRRATFVGVVLVLLVALVISAACRTFCVELYTVAPQQMENTLLPGDRVLVEKWHYGVRLPQSILSLPGVDSLPGCNVPAYIPACPLPYKRLWLDEVGRNDVIVYNYPMGEAKPLSKYPTAMARCIGVPGDVVEARDGALYINGEPSAQSPVATAAYLVADSVLSQVEKAMQQLGDEPLAWQRVGSNNTLFYLDRYRYNRLCEILPSTCRPTPVLLSQDNYVVELPQYDQEVAITPDNAAFYADIINRYEPNKVDCVGDALYRGGRKIATYRFTQPYYWVVCDNRTSATDSRTFGVLPHSHVIGRCGMIVFSIDARLTGFSSWRTQRFFKSGNL